MTQEEIREFAYFNKYGKMPNKSTTGTPDKPKEYALHCGDKIVQTGQYALLVYRKKELEKQGARFLKIKPVQTKAKL